MRIKGGSIELWYSSTGISQHSVSGQKRCTKIDSADEICVGCEALERPMVGTRQFESSVLLVNWLPSMEK